MPFLISSDICRGRILHTNHVLVHEFIELWKHFQLFNISADVYTDVLIAQEVVKTVIRDEAKEIFDGFADDAARAKAVKLQANRELKEIFDHSMAGTELLISKIENIRFKKVYLNALSLAKVLSREFERGDGDFSEVEAYYHSIIQGLKHSVFQ